ncbi:MAG: hypothetical protein IKD20_00500 [Clostridia bacterium]|nr:hypothetical protein [Clostridia bacterium]
MRYKGTEIAESKSHENVYEVRRIKKFSTLNVLIVQTAICLAISFGYLAVRYLGLDDIAQVVSNLVNVTI